MTLASQTTDNLTLVGLTLLGAVPTALVGIWWTRRRGSRARSQLVVVALVPMMATWIGAAVAARGMFLSSHDLGAFVVIAATAGAVGLVSAWAVASRISHDVGALGRLSDGIAEGRTPEEAPPASVGELRRLGAQLTDMAERLDESRRRELALERSRRELVAWVSHDLRSPLAGIRAMAEALEDGVVDDPEDVVRYLRGIGAETDRLAALVDDLFELSRISSGGLDLHRHPVPVDVLVRGVLSACGPAARSRDLELAQQGRCPEPVLVSEAEAGRVLRNLVDNAIRHTPAGGRVTVSTARVDGVVEVAVADECGGIPEHDLERVFDVAFRGDQARGRDDGGGGLGLAIARGLAEAQDGTITVANVRDGCRFVVRFPLAGAGS